MQFKANLNKTSRGETFNQTVTLESFLETRAFKHQFTHMFHDVIAWAI